MFRLKTNLLDVLNNFILNYVRNNINPQLTQDQEGMLHK
jgi:hypothetical protein